MTRNIYRRRYQLTSLHRCASRYLVAATATLSSTMQMPPMTFTWLLQSFKDPKMSVTMSCTVLYFCVLVLFYAPHPWPISEGLTALTRRSLLLSKFVRDYSYRDLHILSRFPRVTSWIFSREVRISRPIIPASLQVRSPVPRPSFLLSAANHATLPHLPKPHPSPYNHQRSLTDPIGNPPRQTLPVRQRRLSSLHHALASRWRLRELERDRSRHARHGNRAWDVDTVASEVCRGQSYG
jgi:hypothetical protein